MISYSDTYIFLVSKALHIIDFKSVNSFKCNQIRKIVKDL